MIIGTLAYYIDELNTDELLRPAPSDLERELSDGALLVVDADPEAAL